MSLARSKYGIEYDPRHVKKDSSGLGWIIVVVIVIAFASLTWTLIGRLRSSAKQEGGPETAQETASAAEVATNQTASAEPPLEPFLEPEVAATLVKRPVRVRNLLMRLEEAERRRDVEMAVSTIETIRALPGSPAADLDNALAHRLGALNLKRLFVQRNAQWVKAVTIRRGDSAVRIAHENGSTLASLVRLNNGNVDKLILGRQLYVMNHPRFNLVIHRRSRMADLSLNGKFFKRYDLVGGVTGKEGAYEVPPRFRNFWYGELGVQLSAEDRAELESLMPTGASVLISEI